MASKAITAQPMSSYEDYAAPMVVLRVNDQPADDLLELMESFEFDDDIKKLPLAKFVFADPLRVLINDSRLEAESVWAVRFGYPADLSRVMYFRLSHFEPTYPDDGVPTITVNLLNKGVSMLRAKRGRNWGKIQTSEIAKRLAKQHKLKFNVENSKDDQVRYVQPHDVSDWEFLRQKAEDIGFECFMEEDTLFYRSKETGAGGPARMLFTYYGDSTPTLLKSFSPEVKAVYPTKVKATGADTAKGAKNPHESKANPGSPGPGAGDKKVNRDTGATSKPQVLAVWDADTGKMLGLSTLEQKDAAADTVKTAETSPAKVKALVAARQRDFLERSVVANATFIGSPCIKAKATYEFQGLDRRLSGLWYATGTKHRIEGSSVYEVSGKLHRGAYNDSRKKQASTTKNAKGVKEGGDGGGSNKGSVVQVNADTGATNFVLPAGVEAILSHMVPLR